MTRTQETETMASTTHRFPTSKIAWDFMSQCDARGRRAGYPSLKPDQGGYYTVEEELLACLRPAVALALPSDGDTSCPGHCTAQVGTDGDRYAMHYRRNGHICEVAVPG